MIALLIMVGLQAAAAQATPVPTVPSPVIERIVRMPTRDGLFRITLFDNRVAVAAVSERGSQVLVRKRTLSPESYVGYLASVTADRPALAELDSDAERLEGGGTGEIIVYGPDDEKLVVRYPVIATHPLPLARVVAMLDDLQQLVLATNPAHDAVMEWVPEVGDRVRMVSGQTATVSRTEEDGTIFVVYDEVGIVELVTRDQRTDRIVELIGPPS